MPDIRFNPISLPFQYSERFIMSLKDEQGNLFADFPDKTYMVEPEFLDTGCLVRIFDLTFAESQPLNMKYPVFTVNSI